MGLTTPNNASPAQIAELTNIVTALGATGAITSELVTIAAGDTLAVLNTSLQQVLSALGVTSSDLLTLITQGNSAYPTGKSPFFYSNNVTGNSNSITIPALAGKLINISNISVFVGSAALNLDNVNIIQDISGTSVLMWEALIGVGGINEVVHDNFNPPLQTNIVNKTVTFVLAGSGLGTGVITQLNINGYYSAA